MGVMRAGKRIVHRERPVVLSPSGLPTQHIVTAADGSTALFLGQQWLQPGERVLRHTHRVEEIISIIAGHGAAMIDGDLMTIDAGTTLYIPAETVHSFWCDGVDPLHVMIIFPQPEFAETTIVSEEAGSQHDEGTPTGDGRVNQSRRSLR